MPPLHTTPLCGSGRTVVTRVRAGACVLMLWGLSGLGHGSDDFGWSGQYRYLASADAVASGGPASAEYLIRVGPDPQDCIIRVITDTTEETIHCLQASRHNQSLALTFQSFEGDRQENRMGVQVYQPGDVLLTLTRTRQGLQTEWETMPPAIGETRRGRHFTRDQNI